MIRTTKILVSVGALLFMLIAFLLNQKKELVARQTKPSESNPRLETSPTNVLNQGLNSKGFLRPQVTTDREAQFQAPLNADLSSENKEKFDLLVPVFLAPSLPQARRSRLVGAFKALGVQFEPLDSRVMGSSVRMIDKGKGTLNGISSVLIRSVKDVDNNRVLEQVGFEMPGGSEALDYARKMLQLQLKQSGSSFELMDQGKYFEHYALENAFLMKLAWFPPFEQKGDGEFEPVRPTPEKVGNVSLQLFFGASH
jgi:hypothetical protein